MRPLIRIGAVAAILVLAGAGIAGCSKKADTAGGKSTALKPADVKIALVPGGAHPYFQPWKTAGAQAKTDFKLGDVTFNETSGWEQTKQNDVLTSMAAQGYNAFGIFGVAPENINATFDNLKRQGFHVGSLASCPAGNTNSADFCLSTDVQEAAYKAAKTAVEAMGGQGNLVHLTG